MDGLRRVCVGAMSGVMMLVGGLVGVRVFGEGAGGGVWPEFVGLPAATRQAVVGSAVAGGGRTIAILGDLSPGNGASGKYLKMAVGELNLLRPEAVFTVGNLVEGETRSGEEYAKEALSVHGVLDGLKMPWYACVGRRDVVSGTRDVLDRRFEGLYRKYFGELYYSAEVGNVHVIVLDSEEGVGSGNGIGEGQMKWLAGDLEKTFLRKGCRYVVVVVHRALWREKDGAGGGNWDKVHEMLVEFNRRPIVIVEGTEGAGGDGRGPRVVGVYAGGARAYSEEPVRDGIHYVVVGATAARLAQDASVEVRGYTVLKFDAVVPAAGEGLGVHAAVVEMGGDGPGGAGAGRIVGADIVTAREREVLEKIEGIPNSALGILGDVDLGTEGKGAGGLKLVLGNPLDVPLDVEIRMASMRNLSTATLRENANQYAESFDSGWELEAPYLGRHLEGGVTERYGMTLKNEGSGGTEVVPPEVEFVVHWGDERGRVHDVILKRKVGVVRRVEVVEWEGKVSMEGAAGWDGAASGGTYVWEVRGDEPKKRGGEWEMTADAERVYLRVKVEDGVASYGGAEVDAAWGGIASDAVSFDFAPGDGSKGEVQRVWVLPFGAGGAEVWRNSGVGEKATKLERMEDGVGVKANVVKGADGYVVTLAVPRGMVMGKGAGSGESFVMNVSVFDNDGGARTWGRSWVREESGPAGWGRVVVKKKEAESQPATMRGAGASTKPAAGKEEGVGK